MSRSATRRAASAFVFVVVIRSNLKRLVTIFRMSALRWALRLSSGLNPRKCFIVQSLLTETVPKPTGLRNDPNLHYHWQHEHKPLDTYSLAGAFTASKPVIEPLHRNAQNGTLKHGY
jgi:hypothetical protein